MYSFDEKGTLAVMLLNDGRFAFLCEACSTQTIDSNATTYARCLFASSLQHLLFFALGDVDRRDLGVDIGTPAAMQKMVRLSLSPPPPPSHPATIFLFPRKENFLLKI